MTARYLADDGRTWEDTGTRLPPLQVMAAILYGAKVIDRTRAVEISHDGSKYAVKHLPNQSER